MSLTSSPTRRSFLGGTCMAAVAATLAACGANSGASSTSASAGATALYTATGGTLTVLTSATDVNWDPAKSQPVAIRELGLVHRRLTTWNLQDGKDVALVADLATDTGTASDDGLTWTYTLKDDIAFEDGTPITSAHVKYGLERSFAPALAGGLGYHKRLLAGAEGYEGPYDGQHLDSIETPDDKTIVFHLERVDADWPWIAATPAFAPVPEDKDDPQTYASHPVASGPYKVTSYTQGSSVTLERNTSWSQATDPVRLALPDSIVWQLAQDESTVSQRLIADSGDDKSAFGADFVSAAALAQVTANAGAKARLATSTEGGPVQYLAINTERVTDLEVRQAISYAVDKAAVVSALGGEAGAVAATTYTIPGIPGREEYDLYPHDAAKAKSLLEGKQVDELVLLVKNETAPQAMAEAVAQSLTEAGLTVRIDAVASDAFYARGTQGDGSTYDLAIGMWNPDYPSAAAIIQPLFASSEIGSGGHNMSRFSDAEVDAAIDAAQSDLDAATAQDAWAALDKQIAEQAPVVPLAYRHNSFLHGSKVTNFFVAPYPSLPNYLVIGLTA
ncbi:ABC transporter substrate-binding protein [Actinomyces radicidentis]|uniref:ABC transporter substrate-binding protein n=1 Tax=Actinomyces radicidentis TaxID=111015 RepID=UPI0026DFD6D2|nr:ABC transporter substrate-binding protein [Actinomyces radicidentis]